jgi:hypothetical protein
VDDSCLANATTRLAKAFDEAEALNDCLTTFDGASIAGSIRTFAERIESTVSDPDCSRELFPAASKSLTRAISALRSDVMRANSKRLGDSLAKAFVREFASDDACLTDWPPILRLAQQEASSVWEALTDCATGSPDTFTLLAHGPWQQTLSYARSLGYQVVGDVKFCPRLSSADELPRLRFATAKISGDGRDATIAALLPDHIAVLREDTLDGSVVLRTPEGGLVDYGNGSFGHLGPADAPRVAKVSSLLPCQGHGVCNTGYAAFFKCWDEYCNAAASNKAACGLIGLAEESGVFTAAGIITQAGLANLNGCHTPEGQRCALDPGCASVCAGSNGKCRLTFCVASPNHQRDGQLCDDEVTALRVPACDIIGGDPTQVLHGVCKNGDCTVGSTPCEPAGTTCVGPGGGAHCGTTTTTTIPPPCGNRVVDDGEECDDGPANGTAGDSCDAQCNFAGVTITWSAQIHANFSYQCDYWGLGAPCGAQSGESIALTRSLGSSDLMRNVSVSASGRSMSSSVTFAAHTNYDVFDAAAGVDMSVYISGPLRDGGGYCGQTTVVRDASAAIQQEDPMTGGNIYIPSPLHCNAQIGLYPSCTFHDESESRGTFELGRYSGDQFQNAASYNANPGGTISAGLTSTLSANIRIFPCP